jgi:hypothetical protein
VTSHIREISLSLNAEANTKSISIRFFTKWLKVDSFPESAMKSKQSIKPKEQNEYKTTE